MRQERQDVVTVHPFLHVLRYRQPIDLIDLGFGIAFREARTKEETFRANALQGGFVDGRETGIEVHVGSVPQCADNIQFAPAPGSHVGDDDVQRRVAEREFEGDGETFLEEYRQVVVGGGGSESFELGRLHEIDGPVEFIIVQESLTIDVLTNPPVPPNTRVVGDRIRNLEPVGPGVSPGIATHVVEGNDGITLGCFENIAVFSLEVAGPWIREHDRLVDVSRPKDFHGSFDGISLTVEIHVCINDHFGLHPMVECVAPGGSVPARFLCVIVMPIPIPLLRQREMSPALSDLDLSAAESFALERGLPRYRGRQIFDALSRGTVWDLADLSSLPRQLRTEIARETPTRTLEARFHLTSKLDASEKVLFGLRDGASIETVLIRSRGEGRDRETVCVSSQVGCPAACTFCATGLGGFTRNLTASEIVDQVAYFAHRLRPTGQRVTNVVFMGMGEPLLNPLAVRSAIERLTDSAGIGLGDRRITVSTVGIVPQIRKFAEWAGQVNLAVSLHAPSDELRSQLVPYNERFPIHQLMEVVRDYIERTNRRVSFEYVLLKDVNDGLPVARQLAELLQSLGGLAHVNLIPWNPFREGHFVRSEGPDADVFAAELRRGGITTTIRYSKGLDISAACGQLREQVQAGQIA